jgi:transposase
MVTGYARWLLAVLIPSRGAPDVFAGWWRLIQVLGGVPRLLVWDGEGAIGKHRPGGAALTPECQAFRGVLATKVYVCRPRDPEAKGLIERAHDYLERAFLPGRVFASPADFNAQLQDFLTKANTRRHRVLGCRPADRIGADRAGMLALPPVPPTTGWRASTRLPRDHYVRLDGNDYSVHPAVIGRRVEVVADLDRVRAVCDGNLVADHERVWAKHQTISDAEHVAAAKLLRLARAGAVRPAAELDVEQRRLSDYDAALGTGGGVA